MHCGANGKLACLKPAYLRNDTRSEQFEQESSDHMISIIVGHTLKNGVLEVRRELIGDEPWEGTHLSRPISTCKTARRNGIHLDNGQT